MAAAGITLLFALYFWGAVRYRRRFPERRFSTARIVAFASGCAVLAMVFAPQMDVRADASFAWHMTQHLLLMFVAPPLLLLGAPLLLVVAATPHRTARAFTTFAQSSFGHALFAPVTGWLVMIFVLWGAHFSPLYELALQNLWIHACEHALFFGAGLLFWNAVVQTGYAPRPVAYPARMLYLFLALPQGAFVAFAIGASNHVLYAHYAAVLGAAAGLQDQRNGADVMWIAGGFALFCAFMLEAAAWAASERRAWSA